MTLERGQPKKFSRSETPGALDRCTLGITGGEVEVACSMFACRLGFWTLPPQWSTISAKPSAFDACYATKNVFQLIGQYEDQLLVVKLKCQLLESAYQFVNEHNKGKGE